MELPSIYLISGDEKQMIIFIYQLNDNESEIFFLERCHGLARLTVDDF